MPRFLMDTALGGKRDVGDKIIIERVFMNSRSVILAVMYTSVDHVNKVTMELSSQERL